MSVLLETIYIKIDFNIPNSSTRYLTRDIFYFPEPEPSELKKGGAPSKYPYFSFDVKYPIDRFQKMTQKDRTLLFFDKNAFSQILEGQSSAKDEYEKYENGNYNVMFMLYCFFPTNFPVYNNLQNSFETKIEKKAESSLGVDFSNDASVFSYVRVLSSVYTVTKVVWVNDFINNEIYRELLNNINKYNDWEKEQKKKLEKDILYANKKLEKANKRFFELYRSPHDPLKQFEDIINKGGDYSRKYYLENIKLKKAMGPLKKYVAEFYDKRDNVDNVLNSIINIKLVLNTMKEYSEFFPEEFDKIYEIAKEVKSDKNILDILEHPEKLNKATKEVKKDIKKYSNLSETINSLKKFSTPIRATSNVNLQKLIESIQSEKKESNKNIQDLCAFIKNVFINKNKNFSPPYPVDLLNIGVMESNLPIVKDGNIIKNRERQLNLIIQVDVFKGVMTNSNVQCVHRNRVLENIYESLKLNGDQSSSVELDKYRGYLDFGGISTEKKGGKTIKRKNRNNITKKNK